MNAELLAKLVALGCEKYVAPLLKKLEERDLRIAALEARIEALEDRHGGRA